MNRRCVLGILMLAFASAPLLAAEPGSASGSATPAAQALPWAGLSPEQQRLLASYQSGWDGLPAARQQALSRGAERWLSMDPAQREHARERFQAWKRLPEARRNAIRRQWQRFQSLPPNQQEQVRSDFRAYMQLSAERRRQLREQWQQKSVEERRAAIERLRERRALQRRRTGR